MIRGRGTALRLPVMAISKGDRKGRPYKLGDEWVIRRC